MAVDVQGVDINGQKRELLTSILGALICSPGIDYTGAYQYLAANTIGQLYVMDAAPNTATGDHPPNELSYATLGQVTTQTSLVGAPGSGKRLRIFSVTITGSPNAGTTSAAVVQDSTSGSEFTPYCYAGQGFTVPYPKTGVAMVANRALQIGIVGTVSAGGYGATVVYTTETV